MIHLIGDSHTLIFRGVPPFWVHHVGAATAWGLMNKNQKTRSVHKIKQVCELMDKEKDRLVLSFGEIDCRVHIFRQATLQNRRMEDIIEEIAKRYVLGTCLWIKEKFGVTPVIYGVPPATIQGNFYGYDMYAEPPVHAVIYYLFNQAVRSKAEELRVPYFDAHSIAVDDEGFTKEEYRKDEVHLNEKIIPKFQEWLNSA